jgi:hypothetical protein
LEGKLNDALGTASDVTVIVGAGGVVSPSIGDVKTTYAELPEEWDRSPLRSPGDFYSAPARRWGVYANCGSWVDNNPPRARPYSDIVIESDGGRHTVMLNHWDDLRHRPTLIKTKVI